MNARVAQLADLTGLVGFKAILLARGKQAQVAAGCRERNAPEAGVHNELGTVHVCALWGRNVWPAGALLRGMCVDPAEQCMGFRSFCSRGTVSILDQTMSLPVCGLGEAGGQ